MDKIITPQYSEEELEFYSSLSESTLALLGLQEISYALAKHALEKRKGQVAEKIIHNNNIFQQHVADHAASTLDSAHKMVTSKGIKNKLIHGANTAAGVAKSWLTPKALSAEAEIKAHKAGVGQYHIAKAAKKTWDLHRAIERKEARSPGWKEKTKNDIDYHARDNKGFKVPEIGSHSKQFKERMEKGKSVDHLFRPGALSDKQAEGRSKVFK